MSALAHLGSTGGGAQAPGGPAPAPTRKGGLTAYLLLLPGLLWLLVFFVAPMVGAFFIDFTNGLIITFFINMVK